MSILKKIFDLIHGSLKEPELRDIANLSEESVLEIARLYGREQGWVPELIPKTPHLGREWRKLYWTIYFDGKGEDHRLFRGGNIFIIVDDETGKIVRKCVQTR